MFGRADRLHVRLGARTFGHRQGTTIQLPVGGGRHVLEQHEGGGHHVRREPLREFASQVPGIEAITAQVSDEHHVTVDDVTAQRHRGRGHTVELCQHRFDLAELDPLAADLDLGVAAPQVFQGAVGATADEVTGAVEAPAVRGGDEPRRRQVRSGGVSPGQLRSAQIEFADRAHRLRAQAMIEDDRVGVPDGCADGGDGLVGAAVVVVGDVDRGLGRAVEIVDRCVGDACGGGHGGRGQRFAAGEDSTQAAQGAGRVVDLGGEGLGECRQHGGDEVHGGDRVALDDLT